MSYFIQLECVFNVQHPNQKEIVQRNGFIQVDLQSVSSFHCVRQDKHTTQVQLSVGNASYALTPEASVYFLEKWELYLKDNGGLRYKQPEKRLPVIQVAQMQPLKEANLA